MAKKFKITSPYRDVLPLLGNEENHYKTNLHTHSTYSDANNTMADMIAAFYDLDFDILAFAEHGILGKGIFEKRRVGHGLLSEVAIVRLVLLVLQDDVGVCILTVLELDVATGYGKL